MGSRNATFHTHSHSPQQNYDSVNDVNTPCWGGELPVWKRGCGLDGGMRSQMEEVKHDMMHASRNKVFCFHLLKGCGTAMRAASLRDAGRSDLGSEPQRGHERIRCVVPTARVSHSRAVMHRPNSNAKRDEPLIPKRVYPRGDRRGGSNCAG